MYYSFEKASSNSKSDSNYLWSPKYETSFSDIADENSQTIKLRYENDIAAFDDCGLYHYRQLLRKIA